ncbi:MAG: glycosyltransferase, partial [Hungatella sp.]
MADLISIIVPVYQSEKYLNQCIESILKQTYGNLELMLVDDGSTDHSLAICREYADRDARVKVIHQENHGVSAARNAGLRQASGDYLMLIDGDDYIHPYMVAELLAAVH